MTAIVAVAVLALAVTAAAAPAGSAAAAKRCRHHRAHHHCSTQRAPLVPGEGVYSSMPAENEQTFAELDVFAHPLRANGRANLIYTCEPSGTQVLLYTGIAQSVIRFSGMSFNATSPVVGQSELISEATAGSITVSAHFTSRSSALVTLHATGVALAHVYPLQEGTPIEGPQTCAVGPLTFKVSKVRAPVVAPPRP
jgi:hypothetical protein